MIIEEHMLLPSRKALAARLVQIEAVLPLEAEFRRVRAHFEYRELDRKLLRIFQQENQRPKDDNKLEDNQVKLDDSLDYLLGRLKESAHADLRHHPSLFDELDRALDTQASGMACEACSNLRPQVCNCGTHDDEIVSSGGACIKPLRELFDIAEAVARHYYIACGTLMTGNPEVSFLTRYENNKPHDFPVDVFVGGLTIFADSPSVTRARVALLIPAERFDTSAYLSSLYALFHECLAHAFHAITPKLARRPSVSPEDRFIEGWMDWISIKVLEEVLDGIGLIQLPSSLRFISQRRDHALAFHLARVKTTGAEISELACQLSTGRNAAIKVFEIFKNRPTECADPWRAFLQLSFDLNMMSDFTQDQRESFVTTLDFLEENDNQPTPSPRHNLLAGIITKYLKNKNMREFVNSVLELKSKWVAR